MMIMAPYSLSNETTRAGFIISPKSLTDKLFNVNDSDAWTELFGCSWNPQDSKPNKCASALSPMEFHSWQEGTGKIRYAAAENLWSD
jgi:hypothetical protein